MPTSRTISTGANINNASRLVLVGLGLLLTLLVPLQVRRFEDSKERGYEQWYVQNTGSSPASPFARELVEYKYKDKYLARKPFNIQYAHYKYTRRRKSTLDNTIQYNTIQ
jgi:hypothetical protein